MSAALSIFISAHRLSRRNAMATARRMRELGHAPSYVAQAVNLARSYNRAAVREQIAARAQAVHIADVVA